MQKASFILSIILWFSMSIYAQENHTVKSPDGKIEVKINLKNKIAYAINYEHDIIISPSAISMKLTGGEYLGMSPKLKNIKTQSVNQIIEATCYKRSKISDHYNELTLNFKNDFGL